MGGKRHPGGFEGHPQRDCQPAVEKTKSFSHQIDFESRVHGVSEALRSVESISLSSGTKSRPDWFK